MAAPKIINWEEAMNQVGGDKDFLDEVLADLLTESQTAKEEIDGAMKARDFAGVMKAAHRIKGSASYLCCECLKEISLKLQDAGHAGTINPTNPNEILANIQVLFADFVKALEDLKAEIASANNDGSAPPPAVTVPVTSGSVKIPPVEAEHHST